METTWSTCAGRWRRPQRSVRPRRPTPGWAASSCRRTRRPDGGAVFAGATAPPGGPHAEVAALAAAGEAARGATLYVTLEPCAHHGRTPPCTDAIIAAGVARVVVGIEDPDEQVAGRGIAALRAAGLEVTVGVAADEVAEQLAPYRKHRTTGQPWVVLKMAASLDGRTAAPGRHQPLDHRGGGAPGRPPAAGPLRRRAGRGRHRAGRRPRADGPPRRRGRARQQPLRVVLGKAPADAKVHPALELSGDLGDVLTELGRRGVLQLLVEGGATRGPRLPRRRPGRPLRPVPGAGAFRGRRRPPDFRGPRGWHNWRRVEGQAGVDRAAG